MQSWLHVLEWRATVRPDLTALVDDRGSTLSYAALRAAVDERAGGWTALGVGPARPSR
jgi:non-ribosomal peptide synthetase component E (peptide arylation enzyme)